MTNNFELKTNQYLQHCDSKDVLSFNHCAWINIEQLLHMIYLSFVQPSSAIDSINNYIANHSIVNFNFNVKPLFAEGLECEILKAGSQGWQKGKLKINFTLEFIPDEPEVEKSPLDDIRQAEINNK